MRPRKKDKHLPPCVFVRNGAYYYVKQNKWEQIGKDLPTALKNYAKKLSAPTSKMPALLERYIASLTLADNTIKSYKVAKNHISKIFAEFEPSQVTAKSIMEVQRYYKDKPGTANVIRAVLIGALDMAIFDDLVDRNVARDTKPMKTVARDRYITDSEYAAIHKHADSQLRIIMDLCYMTGQRISDVMAIKYSDLTDEGIAFKQQKTKHRMIVAWNTDLERTVKAAKAIHQSVKGITLLHNRNGSKLNYDTIMRHWRKACLDAGVEDAHVHDLRAKAATDAQRDSVDSKVLLGHKSESSHNRYLRSRETPVATAMTLKKKA